MATEIVDLPINSMVIFHSFVNIYQRVIGESGWRCLGNLKVKTTRKWAPISTTRKDHSFFFHPSIPGEWSTKFGTSSVVLRSWDSRWRMGLGNIVSAWNSSGSWTRSLSGLHWCDQHSYRKLCKSRNNHLSVQRGTSVAARTYWGWMGKKLENTVVLKHQ